MKAGSLSLLLPTHILETCAISVFLHHMGRVEVDSPQVIWRNRPLHSINCSTPSAAFRFQQPDAIGVADAAAGEECVREANVVTREILVGKRRLWEV